MKNTLLSMLLIGVLTAPSIAQRPDIVVAQSSGRGGDTRDGRHGSERHDSGAQTQGIVVSPRPWDDHDNFDVNVYTDKRTYYYGQNVRIYFRATRDAYVYIFSTDPSGKKRQLFPNYYDRDNWVNGGTTYSIPDRSYSLRATPPSGTETITVVAVREHFRDMHRYRDYSRSNPFPSSYGASHLKSRIEHYGRRGRFYAEDSTSVRIRRPDR